MQSQSDSGCGCKTLIASKDVRTLDATNAALNKLAGNGMHLASAGFTALVAMLCLSDK